MYTRAEESVRVLLAHPGGPFWSKKDIGAWTIPKGLVEEEEDYMEAAKREFLEETGFDVVGELTSLGEITQKSGKIVHAWAVEGCPNLDEFHSNTFEMEWPPRSGVKAKFPEIDKVEWCSIRQAREKMNQHQTDFLDRLMGLLGISDEGPPETLFDL